jgi:hypothetical protein
MVEKLNYSDLMEVDPFELRLKLKARSLLSIQYGLKGWNKIPYKIWSPKDTLAEYVVFADGSEKARNHDSRIQYKIRLLRMFELKQFEMQAKAGEVFIDFVQYLQNKAIKVVVYIPPVSPELYKNETVRNMEKDFEEFIQKLRLDNSLEIIGGLNPAEFGLTTEYYTDDVHFNREAMELIFNEN